MKISLQNLDKAEVLKALYDNSRPLGLGKLHFIPEPMLIQEARALLEDVDYFDYLRGRVMKVNLGGSALDTWGYDRDNGQGAAKRALEGANLPVVVIES